MPIATTDLHFRLSTKSGSAGNSLTSTPNASLGKYMSTSDITDATLENLFDNVGADEAVAGDVEYRCLFVLNNHASLELTGAKVYISAGASAAIGVDPVGPVAKDSASAQAAEIADESAAPAGVSFSAPTDFAGGIALGDIAAGECVAIWVRRTVAAATPALANDGVTIKVEGTTAP